VQVKIEADRTF